MFFREYSSGNSSENCTESSFYSGSSSVSLRKVSPEILTEDYLGILVEVLTAIVPEESTKLHSKFSAGISENLYKILQKLFQNDTRECFHKFPQDLYENFAVNSFAIFFESFFEIY